MGDFNDESKIADYIAYSFIEANTNPDVLKRKSKQIQTQTNAPIKSALKLTSKNH